MTTFHILNFGCRASQADGAALKQQLLQAGLSEASGLEQSHVAVLNTCTVTAAADAEVRQLVRRIHRLNPSCRILVTGCYAQRAPDEITPWAGVTWVVGNSHKHAIAQLLTDGTELRGQKPGVISQESGKGQKDELIQIQIPEIAAGPSQGAENRPHTFVPETQSPNLESPKVLVGEISDEFHFAPVPLTGGDRTRPTLKIQDGCSARCSFCVIPYVRGRSRSLVPEKVIDQVRSLEEAGFQEIVLSGINLGSYGKDLGRRVTFFGLLERILRETGIARVRISSIEPMDVSPALIRLVAGEHRMARHFHVPLQSGCDRILRLMSRRYWATQYAERVLAIREAIPDCGIGADVMVGFPSETDRDHAASARFITSLPFTYLHIFPYSARPGTPAASSPHQVNGRVARERARELREIIAEKRRAFLSKLVGRRVSALTLDEAEAGARLALASQYVKVALPLSLAPANRLLDVWVGRAADGLLYGYANV